MVGGMIREMDWGARRRRVLGSVWVLVAALLALVATLALVESIAHGHYDSHTNRAPGVLIGIAAVGAVAGIGALSSAVGTTLRRARVSTPVGLTLTAATAALIVLYWIAALASGPL
jgi:ABC-type polysaccharide/polyol phosphate export permease